VERLLGELGLRGVVRGKTRRTTTPDTTTLGRAGSAWKGALVPHTAEIVVENLDADKRPLAATADHLLRTARRSL
jgi:hypothetical protein